MRTKRDLRRPQRWAVKKISRMFGRERGIILAWDMGAGKTAGTLSAIRRLFDEMMIRKVLIIAPLLVAERTWPDEIKEWSHTRPLKYVVMTGSEARRKKAFAEGKDAEIHIINKENVAWLWSATGEGKRWDYDVIVIDEASMLKNGRKRTAARIKKGDERPTRSLTRFGYIARMRELTDFVIELTGTPAPKGVHNLWGLAYIADGGRRLGTSRTAFEQRWFRKGFSGFGLEPFDHSPKEITSRLTDIMFSLSEDDYAELSSMKDNVIKVDLIPKILRRYNEFKRELVSEYYDVEAVTAAVLVNKLLQFANGSLYQEDGDHVWVHDEKIDALASIVEEANGAPVLVAYTFKFDLTRIKKKFPKATVLREDSSSVEKWNRGEIPLLLAHPASAGHGLNLQAGGHISTWYGLTHDLELYQQFRKRLHRPGQKKTVFNHHIVAAHTEDERVMRILPDKDATQMTVLKSVIANIT